MADGPTTIQVNGAEFIITALGPHTLDAPWDHAITDQMGVIGNDFRGVEELGSAAFERASNNPVIPDFLNFWYPQTQPRDLHDHRPAHFKATLAGTVEDVYIADYEGTYQDHDVNIWIRPREKYQHLLTDAHPREYTDIMSAQWNLSLHQRGKPNCDDAATVNEFNFIEAEIQASGDIHSGTAQRLKDIILARRSQQICVYGPWIYDKGHCCHAEIHPAEQIWWRTDIGPNEKRYSLSVFCDASQRFWWRDQMDDGTKLKPWGAPPIRGLFAIAFETELGRPPVKFEVKQEDASLGFSGAEGRSTPGAAVTALPWGNDLVLFISDPSGGIYTTLWNPQTKVGDWTSVAEGRSTPGAPVTALPWGNDLVLFISDPSGGIYTTLWNPQTRVGYWTSVAEGRSTPGAPVTALPGSDLVLFISDPNGGIYTTLWNPQTKVGYWEIVRYWIDDRFNVATMSRGIQVYNLTYRGDVLVSFIPNNDLFKASYEAVGLSDANKVRGFLVIETSVGMLNQKVVNADFPLGTDVNKIDQSVERHVFDKAEGHYMFTVLQTDP
jgi:hypothetical protein